MARKTKADALLTRDAILDAAQSCFLANGVARTTLEQVARRAGCTRGAVYWHFRNKADLLTAMMERIEVPFFERFEHRLVSEQADAMTLLRTVFDDLFSAIELDARTRAAMEIMMLRCEMVDDQAFLLERQQRQLETFVAGVALALSKAQEQGRIRSGVDSRDLARCLHAMASGLIRIWLMQPQTETLTATGQRMVETLLAGFECRT